MQMQEQKYGSEWKRQGNDALQKLGLLVVLFSILMVEVVALSGQAQNNNQLCATAANSGYNFQQAAYTIGVAAQKYRVSYNNGKGTSANFGDAAITLCPAQGQEYTKLSPIYKGFDYPGNDAPKNSTHSERQAYHWVIRTLTPAKLQTGDHIYVTIYSEIPVCTLCKLDMVTWNADFQTLLLGSVMVRTQVWQMRRGSPAAVGKDPVPDNEKRQGFVPDDFPTGTGYPLRYRDVEMVPINFH